MGAAVDIRREGPREQEAAPPGEADASLSARLEAVLEEMADFRPRQPHHHPNLLGGEAAIPLERILVSLARGREAIDLAIGEGLCLLEERDQLMDLGYSKMDDYVREELGLPPGVHAGRLRVSGSAPDRLVWTLRSGRRLGVVSRTPPEPPPPRR